MSMLPKFADLSSMKSVRSIPACTDLERKLAARQSPWLFGEEIAMADLFWGLELLRLKNLGPTMFWKDGKLPHVAHYVDAIETVPSINAAILDDTHF